VAVDSEGNVLVTGFTQWDGHSGDADAIVRKWDPDGNEVWTDQFETSHDYRVGGGLRLGRR
jgi:hypothetical protein